MLQTPPQMCVPKSPPESETPGNFANFPKDGFTLGGNSQNPQNKKHARITSLKSPENEPPEDILPNEILGGLMKPPENANGYSRTIWMYFDTVYAVCMF